MSATFTCLLRLFGQRVPIGCHLAGKVAPSKKEGLSPLRLHIASALFRHPRPLSMFGPATFRGCTAANLTRQPHAPSCSGRPPVTWRSSFHSVRTKLQERQQSCSVLPGRRHNMVLARALGERHERLRRTAVSLGTAALVLLNARLAGDQQSAAMHPAAVAQAKLYCHVAAQVDSLTSSI